jgi:hypothetical protein
MMLDDAIGTNDTIGTGEPSAPAVKYVVHSSFLGTCDLIPQEGLEPAGYTIGYVELEGDAGKLLMSIYRDGAWRCRNLKPLPVPVARWFKMVRPDGTEPF